MRILAIDPGYDRCGIAVLEGAGTNPVLVFSACIETDKNNSFSERLHVIGNTLRSLLKEYGPKQLALERLFFSNNQKTALQVAEVRGMILFIAEDMGIPVSEYDPSAIKLAVTGYGRSTKADMIRMLPRLISITKNIQHDDEYDAIGIGITHLSHNR